MIHEIKGFGWKRDLPDHRDLMWFADAEPHIMASLPTSVDLRNLMPTVYDQGRLGSCTANCLAAILQFERKRQHLADDFVPSRLFIYYNERAIEGTINEDSGAMIRDGIRSLNWKGVCHETLMPYVISDFAHKPTMPAYRDALKHKAVQYAHIPQTEDAMKQCLAAGFPFVFGFAAFNGLNSKALALHLIDTLEMPLPNEAPIGGHAVTAVGYDDTRRAFLIRNSWGTDWCDKGYFWMPYDYLTNTDLCDDFWTLRLVSA